MLTIPEVCIRDWPKSDVVETVLIAVLLDTLPFSELEVNSDFDVVLLNAPLLAVACTIRDLSLDGIFPRRWSPLLSSSCASARFRTIQRFNLTSRGVACKRPCGW